MKKEYSFHGFGIGNQRIIVDGQFLTISRSGLTQLSQHGLKGDKTLNIKHITSVQIKQPGFSPGYIQFAIMGSQESKGGVFKALEDENTVTFKKHRHYQDALEIKKYIEMKNNEQPQTTVQSVSVADELLKLKQLLDGGVLTQEEFDEQKKKMLN